MSKPTANLSAGSRGSDPRPLGLTVGGRSDRTFGEATPCIKDCVLVEGQADQAVAVLTLGPGIARVGAMRLIAIADRIADGRQSNSKHREF